MSGSINIFDAIVIAGVIQGIAATIAVWCYPSKTAGRKLLSALLLTLVFLSIKILLHTSGLWQHSGFRYFPLAIDTLIQPLFYLYCCSLTEKDFPFIGGNCGILHRQLYFRSMLLLYISSPYCSLTCIQKILLLKKNCITTLLNGQRICLLFFLQSFTGI